MRGQGRGGGRGTGAGVGRGGGGMGAGGRGRGQGGGGGMGAGGSCICPKCGMRVSHRPGVPCMEERCTECGVALIREGSEHHEKIAQGRGDAGSEETEG